MIRWSGAVHGSARPLRCGGHRAHPTLSAPSSPFFAVLHDLSQLLNTGLSREQLRICVDLVHAGESPEAIAVRRLGDDAMECGATRLMRFWFLAGPSWRRP